MLKNAVGVKGVIITEDQFLVLVKPNGRLDLAGGRVDSNESPEEALFREIFEETGLWQIKNMKHLAHWSFVKNSELHVRGITYLCNYLGGTVKLSREHKEYFWARVEDIHKLIFVPSYGINMIDLKSISGMLK